MQHKGTVVIETNRLILRRFTMDDLEPMYENCWSDPDVWKWTNYAPMHSLSDVIENARMFTPQWFGAYDQPNRYSWAIHHKADNVAIGRMFGMRPDDRLCDIELAYEMGKRWWNQGLMTEAVQATLNFFFLEVGFHRVHAYHAGKNPASGRVMQKCGMRLESIESGGCTCNGGTFDKFSYAIYAHEYSQK